MIPLHGNLIKVMADNPNCFEIQMKAYKQLPNYLIMADTEEECREWSGILYKVCLLPDPAPLQEQDIPSRMKRRSQTVSFSKCDGEDEEKKNKKERKEEEKIEGKLSRDASKVNTKEETDFRVHSTKARSISMRSIGSKKERKRFEIESAEKHGQIKVNEMNRKDKKHQRLVGGRGDGIKSLVEGESKIANETILRGGLISRPRSQSTASPPTSPSPSPPSPSFLSSPPPLALHSFLALPGTSFSPSPNSPLSSLSPSPRSLSAGASSQSSMPSTPSPLSKASTVLSMRSISPDGIGARYGSVQKGKLRAASVFESLHSPKARRRSDSFTSSSLALSMQTQFPSTAISPPASCPVSPLNSPSSFGSISLALSPLSNYSSSSPGSRRVKPSYSPLRLSLEIPKERLRGKEYGNSPSSHKKSGNGLFDIDARLKETKTKIDLELEELIQRKT